MHEIISTCIFYMPVYNMWSRMKRKPESSSPVHQSSPLVQSSDCIQPKCNVRFLFTKRGWPYCGQSLGGLNVFNHLATKRQLLFVK